MKKYHMFSGKLDMSIQLNRQDNHDAIIEDRTLFPGTVVTVRPGDNPLKSGVHSRNIGRIITKGRWSGMPIYTLTLEERATCPRDCTVYNQCYGNNMHLSKRHKHGKMLEMLLWSQLYDLAIKHKGGFAVMLHVLGDFYSVAYVNMWHEMLDEFHNLHVFGFTARKNKMPDDPIGSQVGWLNIIYEDRCHIRFSGVDTEVIDKEEDATGIICPVQTGKKDCCATCALCWRSKNKISFLRC